MKEFKVNQFLTLKLEYGKTNIYMNGELFRQCKFLMLNIPIDETERYEEIESIDEAADKLGWTTEGQVGVKYNMLDDMYTLNEVERVKLDPESEFWGHCSNLQVWYEHDYDTRLLHSTLAFPLLHKLTEVGDSVAKKVFQEEIIKRFENGNPISRVSILESGLLDCLNEKERNSLIN